ncbi:MAG: hypothetical protein CBC38_01005 [Gammaproteobacteria bacterium TMED78]|nr:MAG: hypothetical protein CBC38_01005 [Gammaproteobacteria bacterium TMED78]|tara:strand:+ start:27276 stop:28364 length:1089 start_codon:yes stop_codon:yes gene_type:complete
MGTFDPTIDLVLTGIVTDIAMVNPHAFVYLDAIRDDEDVVEPWRCEMRAATVLRRSGWTEEIFLDGRAITVEGIPDREEPNTCYVATVRFADGTSIDRYQQLTQQSSISTNRPATLIDGTPNIFGDWAAEQRIGTDPRGRRGELVLLSEALSLYQQGIAPNQNYLGMGRAMGSGMGMGLPPGIGIEPTQAMLDSAEDFDYERDMPRWHCSPTNIFFDWTFDSMTNQISLVDDQIIIKYGSFDLYRKIYMNLDSHPSDLEASQWGHSIGKWVDSNLIVDTIGFDPGYLFVPFMYSDEMHVVETFSLDHDLGQLRRTWIATDPKNFIGQYKGSDSVFVSDLPYEPYNCDDRTLSENDQDFLRRL